MPSKKTLADGIIGNRPEINDTLWINVRSTTIGCRSMIILMFYILTPASRTLCNEFSLTKIGEFGSRIPTLS